MVVKKELNMIKRVIYLVMKNNESDQEAYEGIYKVYQDLKNGKIGTDEAMELANTFIN